MSRDDRVRLAFAGLHPDRLQDLLSRQPPGEVVARLSSGSIDAHPSIVDAVRVDAAARNEQLDGAGLALVINGDEGFPSMLDGLPGAPHHLFVQGEPLEERATVAVVGTRRATGYGHRVAEQIGSALAGAGLVVVSGLALGIDGAAHRGTAGALGVGWAVLGCGVDRWYPRRHASLGDRLLDLGGTAVSEFPPGTPPAPWRFPMRNRIISGLASSVVIVEAAAKGGALITARLAMEQGREVFAVPGDIDREVSEGCNRLIADGAIPVTAIDDLLEGLGFLAAARPAHPGIPGLERIDALGTTLDELGERLGIDERGVRIQVGRWEAMGLIRRRGELVMRVREPPVRS